MKIIIICVLFAHMINCLYIDGNMNKLFNDKIEVWEHGPVIREVYNYLKFYGHSGDLLRFLNNEKLSNAKIEKIT